MNLRTSLKTVREKVILSRATFFLDRPAEMDDLLDPSVLDGESAESANLPYWADLWPASRMLAKAILAETWPAGQRCLELGCGLGLPGIAALSRGLKVTFTDADPLAVEFAAHNARLNGFYDLESRTLDWRSPPKDLSFSLVFASDLLYEPRNYEALFQTVSSTLTADGVLWLCDPDRKQAPPFFDLLRARRWNYSRKVVHAGAPGIDRLRGYLYKITRPE